LFAIGAAVIAFCVILIVACFGSLLHPIATELFFATGSAAVIIKFVAVVTVFARIDRSVAAKFRSTTPVASIAIRGIAVVTLLKVRPPRFYHAVAAHGRKLAATRA